MSAKEEIDKLPFAFLKDQASPDELFERLEGAVMSVGQCVFPNSSRTSPEYEESAERRRHLLAERVRLRGSKLGMYATAAQEVDDELRALSSELSAERRRAARSLRSQLV